MNYYQHNYQNYTDKSVTQTFFQQKQMKEYAYKNYIEDLKGREFEFLRNQKCPNKTRESALPENGQGYAARKDANVNAAQKNQLQQTSSESFRNRVEDSKSQCAVGKKSPGNGLSDGEDAKHIGWVNFKTDLAFSW